MPADRDQISGMALGTIPGVTRSLTLGITCGTTLILMTKVRTSDLL